MAVASGGKVRVEGGEFFADALRVENADKVLLLLAAVTSFNGFDKSPVTEGRNPDASKPGRISNPNVSRITRSCFTTSQSILAEKSRTTRQPTSGCSTSKIAKATGSWPHFVFIPRFELVLGELTQAVGAGNNKEIILVPDQQAGWHKSEKVQVLQHHAGLLSRFDNRCIQYREAA